MGGILVRCGQVDTICSLRSVSAVTHPSSLGARLVVNVIELLAIQPRVYRWQLASSQVLSHAPVNRCVEIRCVGIGGRE